MKNNKSYIPFLIVLLVVIVILIVIFTFVLGKTDSAYRDEHLTNIDYKFDKGFYYKNLTNNTMNDFYQMVYNGQETSFLEYKFETSSNTFYETKLDYKDNLIYSLTFSYFLNDNIIRIYYEVSNKNSSFIISGIYYEQNSNLTCNIDSVNNYSSNIDLDSYCNNISTYINDFIKERNYFINDQRFTDILHDDYSEVEIGEN